jgi:hypothetical protein
MSPSKSKQGWRRGRRVACLASFAAPMTINAWSVRPMSLRFVRTACTPFS